MIGLNGDQPTRTTPEARVASGVSKKTLSNSIYIANPHSEASHRGQHFDKLIVAALYLKDINKALFARVVLFKSKVSATIYNFIRKKV